MGIDPVREGHEVVERSLAQQHRDGVGEAARVGHQVPVAGKAHQALHGGEVDLVRRQHGIGRVGIVDHAEFLGMADDRRAAQALEDAELDLFGAQAHQVVEAAREAGHVFARQAGDQVHVQVGGGVPGQPADVLGRFFIVLAPADQRLHLGVEALDADLELQRAGREFGDGLLERFRQVVGHQLEVGVDRVIRRRLDLVEEELHDAQAGLDVQVEGAVDELEQARAFLIHRLHLGQEGIQGEGPGRLVQRGQAEFALERAAARGFHI